MANISRFIRKKWTTISTALSMLIIWQSKMDTGMLHTTHTADLVHQIFVIFNGSQIVLTRNGWQHNWILNTTEKSISQLLVVVMLGVRDSWSHPDNPSVGLRYVENGRMNPWKAIRSPNNEKGIFSKSIRMISKCHVSRVTLMHLLIVANGHQFDRIQIILISLHPVLVLIILRKRLNYQ